MTTRARLKDDGTVVEILRDGSERPLVPEVDWSKIDATTEEEVAAQIAEDDAEAMRDAAAYARRVRRKVGLSQVAFARRIGVPVDTVRNWKQGKRAPQGPAPALLHIVDRSRRFRLYRGADCGASRSDLGPDLARLTQARSPADSRTFPTDC